MSRSLRLRPLVFQFPILTQIHKCLLRYKIVQICRTTKLVTNQMACMIAHLFTKSIPIMLKAAIMDLELQIFNIHRLYQTVTIGLIQVCMFAGLICDIGFKLSVFDVRTVGNHIIFCFNSIICSRNINIFFSTFFHIGDRIFFKFGIWVGK